MEAEIGVMRQAKESLGLPGSWQLLKEARKERVLEPPQ